MYEFTNTAPFDLIAYNFNLMMIFLSLISANPRVVLDLFNVFKANATTGQLIQRPDGMTIDTDGNIYVVILNTPFVFKINPEYVIIDH